MAYGQKFHVSCDAGAISIPNNVGYQRDRLQAASWSIWCIFQRSATASGDFILFQNHAPGIILFYHKPENWLLFEMVNTFTTNEIFVRTGSVGDIQNGLHHIVVTYTGNSLVSGLTLYLDGVSQGLVTNHNNLTSTIISANPMSVGSSALIDLQEFTIYNKALSLAEVQTINSGGPNDTSLVGPTGNVIARWALGGPNDTDLVQQDYGPGGYHASGTVTVLKAGALGVVQGALGASGYAFPQPLKSQTSTLFGGTDEYAINASTSALGFEKNQAFTMVVFFKTTAVSQYLMSKLTGAAGLGYGAYITSTGHLEFQLLGGSGADIKVRASSTRALNDGEWHVAILTKGTGTVASDVNLHVDSAQMPVSVITDAIGATTLNATPFQVSGRTGANEVFTGNITNVGIYNKKFTVQDVILVSNVRFPPDLRKYGPTANLVGYWLMGDETAFPTIPDKTVNGNVLTMTNMEVGDVVSDVPRPLLALPSLSLSLSLATNPYVDLGNAAELNFEWNVRRTISFWVKFTSTATMAIVSKRGTAAGSPGWSIYVSNGNLYVEQVSTAALYTRRHTTATLNNGAWRQVTVVYTAANAIGVRIDGVFQETAAMVTDNDTLASNSILNSTAASIGSRGLGTDFFTGNIDAVAVYNKTLYTGGVFFYRSGRGTDHLGDQYARFLIGYWRFGEGDPYPTVKDRGVLTVGNNGTLVNSTGFSNITPTPQTFTTRSAVFGGPNLRRSVTMGPSPQLGFDRTSPFSVSTWFRTTITSGLGMLYAKYGLSGRGWRVLIDGSNGHVNTYLVNTFVGNSVRCVNQVARNTGAWFHFVWTNSGTGTAAGTKYYYNGVSATVVTGEDTLTQGITSDDPFCIGADSSGRGSFWDGNIDDTAVYNIELSAAQVTTLYGGGTPVNHLVSGPTANLVGYWRMGDGDTYPTITDHSASANHGTMQGLIYPDISLLPSQSVDVPYSDLLKNVAFAPSLGPVLGSTIIDPFNNIQLFDVLNPERTRIHYRMRGLTSPGPGFTRWTVLDEPDFTGSQAPGLLLPNSIVVEASWEKSVLSPY